MSCIATQAQESQFTCGGFGFKKPPPLILEKLGVARYFPHVIPTRSQGNRSELLAPTVLACYRKTHCLKITIRMTLESRESMLSCRQPTLSTECKSLKYELSGCTAQSQRRTRTLQASTSFQSYIYLLPRIVNEKEKMLNIPL